MTESIRYALLDELDPEDSEEFEKALRSDPAFRPPPISGKFEHQLKKALKESKRRKNCNKKQIKLNRRAFQIIVALALITALCCTVLAQFPELFNSVIRIYDEHAVFGAADEPDWDGLYQPMYLPQGYACNGGSDFKRGKDLTRAIFRNSDGGKLLFLQYAPETVVDTDNENAELCKLVDVLGDQDGLYVRKNGENKLFWGLYLKFQLREAPSLDELLKVARSVDFVPGKTG